MSDPQPSADTPQTLGRYELLLPVARGGMGQVWAGRLRGARGFNKLVAIKTLLPIPGAEGRLESMLLEEARIAALIHHPNVVQTLELGEHDNTLYLVMEWVDGESLSFIINRADERGGMPLPIAVNLAAQTLLGLHAAHELTDEAGALLGVVHRDVSPHNVLVTYSGVAKLVDFGIAKATNQDSSVTEAGEVKGKFSYMAPEQIRCQEVDRRADVFAMGILLYTLTTGRHPFKSQHPAGVLHKITSDDPAPRPSLVSSGYSRTLEAVVMKALEKQPENRWRSAEEMFSALQKAVPEAFVPEAETQVKDFLTGLLGDRATLRREGLRRAQVAADLRPGSGTHFALSTGSSQSASSLRALSIDQLAPDQQSGSRPSALLTLPAPAPRRGKILVIALGLATALAGVGLLVHGTGSLRLGPAPSGASPSANMVELHSPASAAKLAASQVQAQPSAAPVPSSAAPEIANVTAEAGASSPRQAAPVVDAAGAVTRKPNAPTNKTRVRQPRNGDLIAPEYAR